MALLGFKIFLYVCMFFKDSAKRYISLSGPLIHIFCTHVVRNTVHRVEGQNRKDKKEQAKATSINKAN